MWNAICLFFFLLSFVYHFLSVAIFIFNDYIITVIYFLLNFTPQSELKKPKEDWSHICRRKTNFRTAVTFVFTSLAKHAQRMYVE